MTDIAPSQKPSWLRRALPLMGIMALALVVFWLVKDFVSFEALRDNRQALLALRDDYFLPTILAFVVIYAAVTALSLPFAAVLSVTGGFLFGLWGGTLINVTGATLGASALFLLVRMGFGDSLRAKLDAGDNSGALARIANGLKENELSFLFLMRLVPAFPFFVANLAPAFLGVSLQRFVVTTFLGIIPGAAVFTWIGAGLGEVFARGETPDLSIFWDIQIIGPILGLCALSAMPILIKAFRKA